MYSKQKTYLGCDKNPSGSNKLSVKIRETNAHSIIGNETNKRPSTLFLNRSVSLLYTYERFSRAILVSDQFCPRFNTL